VKRVLLSGGTGFVGANLARRLLEDGHEVHLLVRPGHTRWRIDGIRADVRLHEVAIADAKAVADAVAESRPEWVFHLATHGAYSWETDLPRMIETTVFGTMHLLEACLRAGFEAFINTGSSSEYGFKDHPPAETEALDPNSHYAVNKAWATMFCRYAGVSRNAPITTLRLYSVYGPFEEPRRLVPTLIAKGLRGELPPLVNPEVARDYVYVDDVMDAYVLAATRAAERPGAVYNVGTGLQTTLREVVEVARRVLGIAAAPDWGSMLERLWDTSVWVADVRAIEGALGWRARHGLPEGFARMVEWLRGDAALRARYEARQA
jgi:UDP-glucose 4-epimerase